MRGMYYVLYLTIEYLAEASFDDRSYNEHRFILWIIAIWVELRFVAYVWVFFDRIYSADGFVVLSGCYSWIVRNPYVFKCNCVVWTLVLSEFYWKYVVLEIGWNNWHDAFKHSKTLLTFWPCDFLFRHQTKYIKHKPLGEDVIVEQLMYNIWSRKPTISPLNSVEEKFDIVLGIDI